MKVVEKVHAQLTTAGESGSEIKLDEVQAASVEGEVTLAGVTTNVVVSYQMSNDDFSTIVETARTTLSADGTYVVPVSPYYREARPYFVSETGGTAATLDFVTRGFY